MRFIRQRKIVRRLRIYGVKKKSANCLFDLRPRKMQNDTLSTFKYRTNIDLSLNSAPSSPTDSKRNLKTSVKSLNVSKNKTTDQTNKQMKNEQKQTKNKQKQKQQQQQNSGAYTQWPAMPKLILCNVVILEQTHTLLHIYDSFKGTCSEKFWRVENPLGEDVFFPSRQKTKTKKPKQTKHKKTKQTKTKKKNPATI